MYSNCVSVFKIISSKVQTFHFLSELNCLIPPSVDLLDRTSMPGSLINAFNVLTTRTRKIVTTTSPTPRKNIEYHCTSSKKVTVFVIKIHKSLIKRPTSEFSQTLLSD